MSLPRVGGHAPAAGGLARAALPYIDRGDATAVQVYVSNPRGWTLSPGDPAQDEEFLAGCAARDVHAYIHASLLVNLGSPGAAAANNLWTSAALTAAAGASVPAPLPRLLCEEPRHP